MKDSNWVSIEKLLKNLKVSLKVVSFKKREEVEKRLPPSLESEAAPQGLAEFHVRW